MECEGSGYDMMYEMLYFNGMKAPIVAFGHDVCSQSKSMDRPFSVIYAALQF